MNSPIELIYYDYEGPKKGEARVYENNRFIKNYDYDISNIIALY